MLLAHWCIMSILYSSILLIIFCCSQNTSILMYVLAHWLIYELQHLKLYFAPGTWKCWNPRWSSVLSVAVLCWEALMSSLLASSVHQSVRGDTLSHLHLPHLCRDSYPEQHTRIHTKLEECLFRPLKITKLWEYVHVFLCNSYEGRRCCLRVFWCGGEVHAWS